MATGRLYPVLDNDEQIIAWCKNNADMPSLPLKMADLDWFACCIEAAYMLDTLTEQELAVMLQNGVNKVTFKSWAVEQWEASSDQRMTQDTHELQFDLQMKIRMKEFFFGEPLEVKPFAEQLEQYIRAVWHDFRADPLHNELETDYVIVVLRELVADEEQEPLNKLIDEIVTKVLLEDR